MCPKPIPEDRPLRSDEAKAYRLWYKTATWRQIRINVLTRDNWQCTMCGVSLVGDRHAPNGAVAHHAKAHKGNRERFFDQGNVVAVCKACHDGPIARQERAETRDTSPRFGADGWPI